MVTTLKVLSVCSGIGGLELGVSRAISTRVVGYCEREAFAASVLMARMEESALDPAPLWVGDLREMDAESFAGEVDLYTGGFPCQPYSQAGKRKASEDERDLWSSIFDHLRIIRPRYAFFENVRGLVSHREGLERVLCDLASIGFNARWTTLKAGQVGSPQHRERLFIMAYADSGGCEGSGISERSELQGAQGGQPDGRGADGRLSGKDVADPISVSSQRWGDPGDMASEGRQAEGEGHQRERSGDTPDRGGYEVVNADSEGLERRLQSLDECADERAAWPPSPEGDWEGVPSWLRPAVRTNSPSVESVLCGLASGDADSLVDAAQLFRTDRLRALGNCVVPSQAEAAFRYLFPHPELLKQS